MEIVLYICFGIYLLIISVEDIRKRKIHILMFLPGILMIPCFWYWGRDMSPNLYVAGLVPGLILLVISFASRGGIGPADVVMVIVQGLCLGIEALIAILSATFIFIAVFSGGMLIFGKLKMKSTVPFIPFTFVGYLFYVILLGINT